jgi:hypothetical protein
MPAEETILHLLERAKTRK